MSQTLSLWSPKTSPFYRPQMLIGAATPLWGYFAGAAMTGVALWWMSRWASAPVAEAPPVKALEMMLPALAAPAPLAAPVEEPVLDAEFVPVLPPPARASKARALEHKPH